MSEEIIIDGVNVAECCCYNKDDEPYCCELYTNECEAQNCYFKQLQRLKQENEALKKAKSIPIPFIDETLVKESKQENEKLKEIEQDYVNFKIAIADIKNIIEFRFKTAYMTFGLEETRKIIKDIEKIVNEVLNDRN